VEIVFVNDDCVVVNKVPGESVEPLLPSASVGMIDLPALLEARLGSPVTAVHRLDVPVSGCVLFARNSRALSFLGKAFAASSQYRERLVEKIYWAVVEMPSRDIPPSGDLVHWIAAGKGDKSEAFDVEGKGKRAELRYRVAGRGERYLFLEIDLRTGRHHQIRAQLARLGLHIKGDLKYGAKRSEREGGIRLHAYSLAFPDPSSPAGEAALIRVSAPPLRNDRLWEAFAACLDL
jgi:23S rRNA pseudouridine1911/1915/1917 synthase